MRVAPQISGEDSACAARLICEKLERMLVATDIDPELLAVI
jgi:hypothetical protein